MATDLTSQSAEELRQRAELARITSFKCDFYALPQPAQDALYGLAAVLESAAAALEAAEKERDEAREDAGGQLLAQIDLRKAAEARVKELEAALEAMEVALLSTRQPDDTRAVAEDRLLADVREILNAKPSRGEPLSGGILDGD